MSANKAILRSRDKPWFMLILASVALTGACFVWYGTVWGPWAFSDGVGYIVNARNLLLGRGLGIYRASGDFILLVTHPPLYPYLLAALGKAGLDLVTAARWIDVVLFGGFLFASGWGFWRVTRSTWLALGLAAVLLLHPAMLLAYLSAMSEPLFLICIVSSLLLMTEYLLTEKRALLVLAAVTAAGALFTRYPGAAVIISEVAALWLVTRTEWHKKAWDSLVYAGISLAPTLAFVLWTRFVLDARNPRGIKSSFDLPTLVKNFTKQSFESVWNWKPVPPDVIPNQLIPMNITHPLVIVLTVVLGAGLGWAVLSAVRARRRMEPSVRPVIDWRPAALFGLFLLSYLGFFGTAYLVTSPTPDVDARTLLPLLPVGLLLMFSLANVVQHSAPNVRLFNAVFAVTIVLALAGWAIISQDTVVGMHRTGLGYTSRAWQGSDTMQAVENLPTDLTLVSNETAAILLYTDRSAYEIPGLKAGDTNPLAVPFGSGASDLDQAYRDGRAALVLFDSIKAQLRTSPNASPNLSPDDLTAGLNEVFSGDDGSIYCRCAIEDQND